jgi:signal transduction histidine kinase/CheY-like chemotaxis protein
MNDRGGQNYRILAVDDEDIVLSFITDALEDEGYGVVTATNGEEAIRLAAEQTFDLLLTDIRMPGIDGIELAKRIRELSPGVAVIFMTGYANLNSAKDAIKQGAIDYIMKPFELSEIRQAVRNARTRKIEADEQSSDHQLRGLSDLNSMLFRAGDRRSLIVSSLKFAMMHQHADHGSVLFYDPEPNRYILMSIRDDTTQELSLAAEPLHSVLAQVPPGVFDRPMVITSLDDHPIYSAHADPSLKPYLQPSWFCHQVHMVLVPVSRVSQMYAIIMLGYLEDTVKLTETAMQFLAITGSQLAITLENLELLNDSQKAYKRLKELQDETIELEKMAARGQMSAEIGHELNNFLGVIAGNISMLDVNLKKRKLDDLERYVTSAVTTIDQIKSFTANLMDLHPISSEKETVRFDKIITEVIAYLTPQRRFRDVEIDVIHVDDDAYLEADTTQIKQLLYNLFNNAADATKEKGNGRIQISVLTDQDESAFTLTVSDNGVGFEPELLRKAFQERFTTKPTGHGFGLTVCRRIIDNHGGELQVDSTPGEGTRISVAFPLAAPAAQPV